MYLIIDTRPDICPLVGQNGCPKKEKTKELYFSLLDHLENPNLNIKFKEQLLSVFYRILKLKKEFPEEVDLSELL